jgi:hypothetical protein
MLWNRPKNICPEKAYGQYKTSRKVLLRAVTFCSEYCLVQEVWLRHHLILWCDGARVVRCVGQAAVLGIGRLDEGGTLTNFNRL